MGEYLHRAELGTQTWRVDWDQSSAPSGIRVLSSDLTSSWKKERKKIPWTQRSWVCTARCIATPEMIRNLAHCLISCQPDVQTEYTEPAYTYALHSIQKQKYQFQENLVVQSIRTQHIHACTPWSSLKTGHSGWQRSGSKAPDSTLVVVRFFFLYLTCRPQSYSLILKIWSLAIVICASRVAILLIREPLWSRVGRKKTSSSVTISFSPSSFTRAWLKDYSAAMSCVHCTIIFSFWFILWQRGISVRARNWSVCIDKKTEQGYRFWWYNINLLKLLYGQWRSRWT